MGIGSVEPTHWCTSFSICVRFPPNRFCRDSVDVISGLTGRHVSGTNKNVEKYGKFGHVEHGAARSATAVRGSARGSTPTVRVVSSWYQLGNWIIV